LIKLKHAKLRSYIVIFISEAVSISGILINDLSNLNIVDVIIVGIIRPRIKPKYQHDEKSNNYFVLFLLMLYLRIPFE
jgi:hypothetical protein